MQTLNEYMQANQDDIMDILENEVDSLSIPLQLRTKFISLLNGTPYKTRISFAGLIAYNANNQRLISK